MVGIKPGADKLTPMDYGEAKACMEMFAAQELAEYKAKLKDKIESYHLINKSRILELIDKL